MARDRITAGQRSHLVTIASPAGVLSAAASDVETGVPAAITVTPPSFQRSEGPVAGGVRAQTEYTVNLRYRTDLRSDFELREECCTQRVFQILSVVPDDRRASVDLRCVTAS